MRHARVFLSEHITLFLNQKLARSDYAKSMSPSICPPLFVAFVPTSYTAYGAPWLNRFSYVEHIAWGSTCGCPSTPDILVNFRGWQIGLFLHLWRDIYHIYYLLSNPCPNSTILFLNLCNRKIQEEEIESQKATTACLGVGAHCLWGLARTSIFFLSFNFGVFL
jgi:hypothetical protein